MKFYLKLAFLGTLFIISFLVYLKYNRQYSVAPLVEELIKKKVPPFDNLSISYAKYADTDLSKFSKEQADIILKLKQVIDFGGSNLSRAIFFQVVFNNSPFDKNNVSPLTLEGIKKLPNVKNLSIYFTPTQIKLIKIINQSFYPPSKKQVFNDSYISFLKQKLSLKYPEANLSCLDLMKYDGYSEPELIYCFGTAKYIQYLHNLICGDIKPREILSNISISSLGVTESYNSIFLEQPSFYYSKIFLMPDNVVIFFVSDSVYDSVYNISYLNFTCYVVGVATNGPTEEFLNILKNQINAR